MECPLYKRPLYRDFLIRVWPGKRSVPRFTVRLTEMSALWCVCLIEIPLYQQMLCETCYIVKVDIHLNICVSTYFESVLPDYFRNILQVFLKDNSLRIACCNLIFKTTTTTKKKKQVRIKELENRDVEVTTGGVL